MKVIVKWPVQHHSRLVMGLGTQKSENHGRNARLFWYPTWTRPITNSTPISQKSEKTIRPAFNEEGFECISHMYVCRYIHIYLLAPKKFCWTKFIFHMVSFLSFLQQNSLCPLKKIFFWRKSNLKIFKNQLANNFFSFCNNFKSIDWTQIKNFIMFSLVSLKYCYIFSVNFF